MRLGTVVFLLIVLAGCAKVADKKQEPKPDQRNIQPQGTAESIAKEMFPNAPEKAKRSDCFRGLNPEMSVNAVVQKCGRPDEETGSGIYIFVWHLSDGSSVSIGTPYLDRIGQIRITDSAGKTSSLP